MVLDRDVEDRWNRMLEDSDPKLQMDALTEIGRSYFRTPGGTEERTLSTIVRDKVLEKLQDKDADMRAEAVLALVHWKDEETTKAIEQALSDQDVPVRLAAIQTAAMVNPNELVTAIINTAKKEDEEEVVRAQAVDALRSLNERAYRENIVNIEDITLGPIRTKGKTFVDLSDVLDDIQQHDKSSYVRFMAG